MRKHWYIYFCWFIDFVNVIGGSHLKGPTVISISFIVRSLIWAGHGVWRSGSSSGSSCGWGSMSILTAVLSHSPMPCWGWSSCFLLGSLCLHLWRRLRRLSRKLRAVSFFECFTILAKSLIVFGVLDGLVNGFGWIQRVRMERGVGWDCCFGCEKEMLRGVGFEGYFVKGCWESKGFCLWMRLMVLQGGRVTSLVGILEFGT